MKKSLIWTTVGATVIGFGVPAYAAVQSSKPQPRVTTVVTPAAPRTTADDSTRNSVDDNGVDITTNSIDDNGVDATTNSIDDNGVDITTNSIDDNGVDITTNSIDDNGVDATDNTVEDISGPCDEAEHANDPRCTGASAPVNTVDDSGNHNGSDDSGHHGGGDDSGHGGSDD